MMIKTCKLEHASLTALAHYVDYQTSDMDIGDESLRSVLVDDKRFILTISCFKGNDEDHTRKVKVLEISSYSVDDLLSYEVPSFLQEGI